MMTSAYFHPRKGEFKVSRQPGHPVELHIGGVQQSAVIFIPEGGVMALIELLAPWSEDLPLNPEGCEPVSQAELNAGCGEDLDD